MNLRAYRYCGNTCVLINVKLNTHHSPEYIKHSRARARSLILRVLFRVTIRPGLARTAPASIGQSRPVFKSPRPEYSGEAKQHGIPGRREQGGWSKANHPKMSYPKTLHFLLPHSSSGACLLPAWHTVPL